MGVGYQDLVVWQKSMNLVTEVYRLVRLLPRVETYALSDQMRRAAVSIPSNIAEGKGRNTKKEYVNFLCIARGSLYELRTQVEICCRLGYVKSEQCEVIWHYCDEVGSMLNALISKLRRNFQTSV